MAYSKNIVAQGSTITTDTRIETGALALLFGTGFLPNTLLGWIIIILLIVLLILAIRRFYDRSTVVVTNGASQTTTTETHH